MKRLALLLLLLFVAPSFAADRVLALEQARKQRYDAAHRPRQLVFHSDGVAMNPRHAYHEPTPSVIPHLPGTQTNACTYSLIHQFPVVRLYRSKVGQEWPAGITAKLFGNGPDGLDQYITFCRKHGYEAFWAMRTNDTHDATNDAHGRERWTSNLWKQAHPELLFGTRDAAPPPFGNWTAFDYAQDAVRDKVFDVVAEVARNYPVDGLLLDFFRHLPTFKSTAWGAQEAGDQERAALTALLRRLRDMRDQVGRERGQPVLLAVRTPDTFEYCRALGLDLEQWMREGLIDIWITSGYFRLQEWDDIVKLARVHDIPVWASMDESRVKDRTNRNSLEAYRARIMNAWRSGVDAIWMFNYFHFPDTPEFQLLREAGAIETLAFTNKAYVPDDLGPKYAGFYLADGLKYVRRPRVFAPADPERLPRGQSRQVEIRVGDDVGSAAAHGYAAKVSLRLQADAVPDDLRVELGGRTLLPGSRRDGWLDFPVEPSLMKLGANVVTLHRGDSAATDTVLKDLQLSIDYERKKGTAGQAKNPASEGTVVRVAAISFKPVKFDLAGNADRLEKAFRAARQGNARIAVAPEGVLEGYVVNEIIAGKAQPAAMKDVAVTIDDPVIRRFQALARELEMCLVFGFAERIRDDVFNCAVFIDESGRIRGKHHKMQLAEGSHPDWWFNRLGIESRAFDTPYGRCGIVICNERWNPQLARILALDGARFLVIPSYGTSSKSQDDAVLSRGRENGVPIVEANVGVTLVVNEGRIAAVDRNTDSITFGEITIPPAIAAQPGERDREEREFLQWRETEMKTRYEETMKKTKAGVHHGSLGWNTSVAGPLDVYSRDSVL